MLVVRRVFADEFADVARDHAAIYPTIAIPVGTVELAAFTFARTVATTHTLESECLDTDGVLLDQFTQFTLRVHELFTASQALHGYSPCPPSSCSRRNLGRRSSSWYQSVRTR